MIIDNSWTNHYSAPGKEAVRGLAAGPEGRVYLTGTVSRPTSIEDVDGLSAFLRCVDADTGALEWVQEIGGFFDQEAVDVAVLESGKVIVAGNQLGLPPVQRRKYAWLAGYSSDGSLQFQYEFPKHQQSGITCLTSRGDSVAVGGYSIDDQYGFASWVALFDGDGNVIAQHYGLEQTEQGLITELVLDEAGNLFLSGVDVSDKSRTVTEACWVCKLDKDGETVFFHSLPPLRKGAWYSLGVTESQDLVVAGALHKGLLMGAVGVSGFEFSMEYNFLRVPGTYGLVAGSDGNLYFAALPGNPSALMEDIFDSHNSFLARISAMGIFDALTTLDYPGHIPSGFLLTRDLDLFLCGPDELVYDDPASVREQETLAALSEETAARILAFVNGAEDQEAISGKGIVKDDPDAGYGDQVNDYGIGEVVAQRILDYRDALPGGQLTEVRQLLDVKGLGQDKLNDLIYTFSMDGEEDGEGSREMLALGTWCGRYRLAAAPEVSEALAGEPVLVSEEEAELLEEDAQILEGELGDAIDTEAAGSDDGVNEQGTAEESEVAGSVDGMSEQGTAEESEVAGSDDGVSGQGTAEESEVAAENEARVAMLVTEAAEETHAASEVSDSGARASAVAETAGDADAAPASGEANPLEVLAASLMEKSRNGSLSFANAQALWEAKGDHPEGAAETLRAILGQYRFTNKAKTWLEDQLDAESA